MQKPFFTVPTPLSPIGGHVSFAPQPQTWVKLRDPLSTYSFDEALLLCKQSDGSWVAWVPDLGETVLARHQFYSIEGLSTVRVAFPQEMG